MTVENSCVPGNGTDSCSPPGSPTGLAVGLTLFFLLLLILAGVIYKNYSKISSFIQSQQRRSQNKENFTDTAQADPQQSVSPIGEQSADQTPIYENLATHTSDYKRPAANQSRFQADPEEDVYLQCDDEDGGIYSNDPVNISVLPACQEEDVYIMPDSV